MEVKSNGSWIMNLGWAQVIAHPDHNLINVDCRPAALLDRDASTSRLLHQADMRKAAESAHELVTAIFSGHAPGSAAVVRRLDLTVDIRNRSLSSEAPEHGAAIMYAFADARPPRWRPKPHPRPGGHGNLEGVSFHTELGGQLVFRAYDKGFERSKRKNRIRKEPEALGDKATFVPHPEACPPGLFLRFERQWRPTNSEDSLTLDAFEAIDLRGLFLGQFKEWKAKGGPPVVCGVRAAEDHVQRLFFSGQIGRRRLNTLLGQIALLHDRVFDDSQDGRDPGNKSAEESLRREGLILSRHLPRLAAVRLGDLVLSASEALPRTARSGDEGVPEWFSC